MASAMPFFVCNINNLLIKNCAKSGKKKFLCSFSELLLYVYVDLGKRR